MIIGLMLYSIALSATAAPPRPVTAGDPQSIASALNDAGYAAKLSTEAVSGNPMINSSTRGKRFVIFFYGCKHGYNCTDIQFFAGWNEIKSPLAQINLFNENQRYARAYVSSDGATRIEMDVDLDLGGISCPLFQDYLRIWNALMGKFQAEIEK